MRLYRNLHLPRAPRILVSASRPPVPDVSADVKGSQFSRFGCEPESLPVIAEHTNAAAAVRKQAVTIVSFFPASDG